MAASNFSLHTQNSSQLDNSLEVATLGPGIEYFVLASALGFIMLLALFGNGILIVTMCRTPSLRTRTNMLILNLACADLGVALLCMPFSIITCFSRDWVFGDSLCHLNGFLNILFECSSLFTLTAISIEKYFSIVKPLARVITTRLAWIMVAMTWIAALILALMPLTGFITFDFKAGSTQCGVQVPITLGQSMFAFVVLLVAYLIPLCIMGFCYVNIFRAARRHNIRVSRISLISTDSEKLVSSQNQVAVTIFIMFIAFFLCWTPYFAYMVYMAALQIKSPDAFMRCFGLASYWCAFLNSCIDPFVYGVRNPLIRKELRAKCCRRYQDSCSRHNSMQKAQISRENGESHLKPPQLYADSDETTPVYPAYINFVALTEEDIVSPNEGISKLTTDRSNQTGHVLQPLTTQDLCKVSTHFITEQDCGRNQTPPKGFTVSPFLFQDNADTTKDITCSRRLSACSENDHVTNSDAKMVTCFSDSSEDSSCSDGDSVKSVSSCSCDNESCFSCDGPSCSSKSCVTNTFSSYFSNQTHTKNTKTVSFLSTKETAKKFKIGWMESQL